MQLNRRVAAAGCRRAIPAVSFALVLAAGADVCRPALAAPGAVQENPAGIIAAHIRQQGYACDHAQQAIRNRRASRPNETVWILRCDNATYRVRLVPDMAAQVEVIK